METTIPVHRQATALLEGMGFSFNRANKHLFIDKLKGRDGKKCDINMSARKTVKRPPDRDPEVRGQEKGLFELKKNWYVLKNVNYIHSLHNMNTVFFNRH